MSGGDFDLLWNPLLAAAILFAFSGSYTFVVMMAWPSLNRRARGFLVGAFFVALGLTDAATIRALGMDPIYDHSAAVVLLAAYFGRIPTGIATAIAIALTQHLLSASQPSFILGNFSLDILFSLIAIYAVGLSSEKRKSHYHLLLVGVAAGCSESLTLLLPGVQSAARDSTVLLTVFFGPLATTLLLGKLFGIMRDSWFLQRKNRHQAEELRHLLHQVIAAFSTAMVHTDPYTAGHERRVADLARTIGEKLGLDDERAEGLQIAAMLHDVGQVKIPAEILVRPRALTALEMEFVRQHVEVGYEILSQISFPWPIAQIVLQHHENHDGSGYPHGLKGDEILLEASIISVADHYEALVSHRPYRPAFSEAEAVTMIRGMRGNKLNPLVVDAFLNIVESVGYRFPPAAGIGGA